MGKSSSGHVSGREDGNDMDPPSPCSSTGEKSYDGEEWYHSLELTDDFSVLDGEVGKRLNQMVPIRIPAATIVEVAKDSETDEKHVSPLSAQEEKHGAAASSSSSSNSDFGSSSSDSDNESSSAYGSDAGHSPRTTSFEF